MTLLDTSICILILRGREIAINRYLQNAGNVAIPFMVAGELHYGAAHSRNPVKEHKVVDKFLSVLPVIHSSNAIMQKFGELKAALAAKGTLVEDADTLIAATALVNRCPIATANVAHFSRFPGLTIENWLL